MEIQYHTTRRIWLHLEDHYNAGLDWQEARKLIEEMDIMGLYHKLTCKNMGLNGNWIVEVPECNDNVIEYIVNEIKNELNFALYKKRIKV
jgi:hypothetical protein